MYVVVIDLIPLFQELVPYLCAPAKVRRRAPPAGLTLAPGSLRPVCSCSGGGGH